MRRRTWLELGAVWGMLACHVHAKDSRRDEARAVRIGLTAVILADQAGFLARWSDYLGVRMGVPVVFVARESYQHILDLLFSEQLDAAWICGYPYVLHRHKLQLLSTPLFNGKPQYQAYLVSQKFASHPIGAWGDLKQRVLAYSDPLSNSGWLVAQSQLRAAGLTERDLRHSFFAHGHRNVAEAVAVGLAHAGCMDGYVWDTMHAQNMPTVLQTTVVWRSDWFAFPPLVARKGDRNRALPMLGDVLQGMHTDSQGVGLLGALNLSGFAKPDASIFEPIRLLANQVGGARL